ncbi:hypothetical protein BZA77DRAFT_297770 [Pyronema omphalodes]|nr:hypothetical protein BZA77DRAFT_297770 [Pyronema omphalodes]
MTGCLQGCKAAKEFTARFVLHITLTIQIAGGSDSQSPCISGKVESVRQWFFPGMVLVICRTVIGIHLVRFRFSGFLGVTAQSLELLNFVHWIYRCFVLCFTALLPYRQVAIATNDVHE